MEAAIALLYGLAITGATVGVLYAINSKKILLNNRLKKFAFEEKEAYSNPELNRPIRERLFAPAILNIEGFLKNFIPKEKKQAYTERLLAAGNPKNLTPDRIIIIKYLILFTALIVGIASKNIILGLL
jgi:tight adherence protein C